MACTAVLFLTLLCCVKRHLPFGVRAVCNAKSVTSSAPVWGLDVGPIQSFDRAEDLVDSLYRVTSTRTRRSRLLSDQQFYNSIMGVVAHAGVAVVAVMCITTAMASICMLLVWRLHPILPLSFWLVLTCIEGTYLTSVLYKVHSLLFPLLLRTPKSSQFCTRYTCCCSHPY